jgi:oxygen-independent coproporphyrinogen-3 oxidase
MDIIAGLPGETISDIERTMEFIKKLNPENITVHTLAIKKGSKLKEIASSIGLPDEGEVEKMIRKTREHASKMDMRPYYLYRQKYMLNNMENTGYSKRGYECIYNIQMMEDRQTIIGFGAGSITKVVDFETWEINRISNPKDISEYIKRIDELIKRKLNNDILNRLT